MLEEKAFIKDHDLPETAFLVLVCCYNRDWKMQPVHGAISWRCCRPRNFDTCWRNLRWGTKKMFDVFHLRMYICLPSRLQQVWRTHTQGDIDYCRDVGGTLTSLLHGSKKDESQEAWVCNLPKERFIQRFGQAVCTGEPFANDTWEWKRSVCRSGEHVEAMCNPA